MTDPEFIMRPLLFSATAKDFIVPVNDNPLAFPNGVAAFLRLNQLSKDVQSGEVQINDKIRNRRLAVLSVPLPKFVDNLSQVRISPGPVKEDEYGSNFFSALMHGFEIARPELDTDYKPITNLDVWESNFNVSVAVTNASRFNVMTRASKHKPKKRRESETQYDFESFLATRRHRICYSKERRRSMTDLSDFFNGVRSQNEPCSKLMEAFRTAHPDYKDAIEPPGTPLPVLPTANQLFPYLFSHAHFKHNTDNHVKGFKPPLRVRISDTHQKGSPADIVRSTTPSSCSSSSSSCAIPLRRPSTESSISVTALSTSQNTLQGTNTEMVIDSSHSSISVSATNNNVHVVVGPETQTSPLHSKSNSVFDSNEHKESPEQLESPLPLPILPTATVAPCICDQNLPLFDQARIRHVVRVFLLHSLYGILLLEKCPLSNTVGFYVTRRQSRPARVDPSVYNSFEYIMDSFRNEIECLKQIHANPSLESTQFSSVDDQPGQPMSPLPLLLSGNGLEEKVQRITETLAFECWSTDVLGDLKSNSWTGKRLPKPGLVKRLVGSVFGGSGGAGMRSRSPSSTPLSRSRAPSVVGSTVSPSSSPTSGLPSFAPFVVSPNVSSVSKSRSASRAPSIVVPGERRGASPPVSPRHAASPSLSNGTSSPPPPLSPPKSRFSAVRKSGSNLSFFSSMMQRVHGKPSVSAVEKRSANDDSVLVNADGLLMTEEEKRKKAREDAAQHTQPRIKRRSRVARDRVNSFDGIIDEKSPVLVGMVLPASFGVPHSRKKTQHVPSEPSITIQSNSTTVPGYRPSSSAFSPPLSSESIPPPPPPPPLPLSPLSEPISLDVSVSSSTNIYYSPIALHSQYGGRETPRSKSRRSSHTPQLKRNISSGSSVSAVLSYDVPPPPPPLPPPMEPSLARPPSPPLPPPPLMFEHENIPMQVFDTGHVDRASLAKFNGNKHRTNTDNDNDNDDDDYLPSMLIERTGGVVVHSNGTSGMRPAMGLGLALSHDASMDENEEEQDKDSDDEERPDTPVSTVSRKASKNKSPTPPRSASRSTSRSRKQQSLDIVMAKSRSGRCTPLDLHSRSRGGSNEYPTQVKETRKGGYYLEHVFSESHRREADYRQAHQQDSLDEIDTVDMNGPRGCCIVM